MRIALLADIHGNPIALDAVLADIRAQGPVDGYWILGDLSALGYDPITVLERLQALNNTVIIRGNTDRYLVTGRDRPPPSRDEALHNPEKLNTVLEIHASLAWTQGYLTPGGWLEWLAKLPLGHRTLLPDNTGVLLVHAAPGRDDGPGLHPHYDDDAFREALAGVSADLVLVGHTHRAFDRQVDGVRVVNPGSVSNPVDGDLRASYAILEADIDGYAVNFFRVAYDREACIAALERVRHPGAAYITRMLRGQVSN